VTMPVLEFQFGVGEDERHEVGFRFNRTWGPLMISVDDQPVVKKFEMFRWSTTERFELTVGETERHDVVIEKKRKRWMSGFFPHQCIAYVDDEEVGRYSG
jgi:hypothetical protein